jgi:predicted PurR-regulated permease PerM
VKTPISKLDGLLWVGVSIVAVVLLWQLSGLLLLVFASILVAIMLLAIAARIQKIVQIGPNWALLVSCLFILLFVAGFFLILGTQLIAESARLKQELPKLLLEIGDQFGIQHFDRRIIGWVQGLTSHDGVMGRITATTSLVVSGFADALLVVVAGVYLAANPSTYRNGILRLVPPRCRDDTAHFMETSGRALTLWLAGQLVTMAAVGTLFAIGLLFLGIPSALALGFVAGVAEFVPYAGPILGAIPALLIALSMGRNEILGVLALYCVVQALEGNVIWPLIQRRMVDLPPVLTLFAIVAIGGIFGLLGLLLATPLTVIGFIAVKQFYLRDMLKQHATIPGEAKAARK